MLDFKLIKENIDKDYNEFKNLIEAITTNPENIMTDFYKTDGFKGLLNYLQQIKIISKHEFQREIFKVMIPFLQQIFSNTSGLDFSFDGYYFPADIKVLYEGETVGYINIYDKSFMFSRPRNVEHKLRLIKNNTEDIEECEYRIKKYSDCKKNRFRYVENPIDLFFAMFRKKDVFTKLDYGIKREEDLAKTYRKWEESYNENIEKYSIIDPIIKQYQDEISKILKKRYEYEIINNTSYEII